MLLPVIKNTGSREDLGRQLMSSFELSVSVQD